MNDFWLSLCEPLTSPYAALIGAGLIALVFAVFLCVFLFRTRSIVVDLESAHDVIKGFQDNAQLAAEYGRLDEEMKRNGLMKSLWQEYAETLLPARDGLPSIRNIHESHVFFNEAAVLTERVNVTFWRATPNYLTGFGILGTFVGLVAGISLAQSGLTSGDTAVVNESLSRLLRGASLAFATSLVGVALSIALSWCIHHRFHCVHKLITRWNERLDSLMHRVSLEQLSDDALQEARDQTSQLKSFTTDLAVALGDVLDDKITHRLNAGLERMVASMEAMREDQHAMGEDTLTRVVEEFQKSLTGNAGTALDGLASTLSELNSQMRNTMDGFAAGQREFGETQRQLAREVRESIHAGGQQIHEEMSALFEKLTTNMADASEQSAERLSRSGSDFANQVDGTMQSLREAVETMSHAMLERNSAMQETAGKAAERMQEEMVQSALKMREDFDQAGAQLAASSLEASREIIDALGGFSESVELLSLASKEIADATKGIASVVSKTTDLAGQFSAAAELVGEASRPLQEGMDEVRAATKGMRDASEGIRGYLGTVSAQSTELSSATQRTQELWQRHSRHFDSVDEALRRVFDELQTGLQGYTDKISDFHRDLDQHIGAALRGLTAVAQELKEVGETFAIAARERRS